jgi:hypothetical protein
MTFRQGLIKARGQITFLAGLIAACGIAMYLDRGSAAGAAAGAVSAVHGQRSVPSPAGRPLSPGERESARIAWKYFENNTQTSGLVNSVDRYRSTTMWECGSAILAIVSAERVGVIGPGELDRRLTALLRTLAALPLFELTLPNKSYDTASLQMVTYDNRRSPRGIGWSAIDIARLVLALKIVAWNYPQHAAECAAVIRRWDLRHMLGDGVLHGARVENGMTEYPQEGRLGYEQYAARALLLDGRDTGDALNPSSWLRYVGVDGVEVPVDRRTASSYGAYNYVVSEPYVLEGLELGWNHASGSLAYSVFTAQQQRYERTGVLTAVTEDHIDRAPYFVYNTVYAEGKAWNAITDRGDDASAFRTLSVKAAFGWNALYGTGYTSLLERRAGVLFDPERGFYAGLYERTGQPNKAVTCNTNAVILESLAYRSSGPLLSRATQGH